MMPHLQSDPLKPLNLNISSVILMWVSWLWIWRVIKVGVKIFSEGALDSKVGQDLYRYVKLGRKYVGVFYVFITW
jgi:hypothetical protein